MIPKPTTVVIILEFKIHTSGEQDNKGSDNYQSAFGVWWSQLPCGGCVARQMWWEFNEQWRQLMKILTRLSILNSKGTWMYWNRQNGKSCLYNAWGCESFLGRWPKWKIGVSCSWFYLCYFWLAIAKACGIYVENTRIKGGHDMEALQTRKSICKVAPSICIQMWETFKLVFYAFDRGMILS